jgi:hypothetical protein
MMDVKVPKEEEGVILGTRLVEYPVNSQQD